MSRDWHRDLISPVRDRGGLAALLNRVGARLLNIERAPGVIRRVQPVIVPKLPGLTQPAVTPPTLAPLADARASIGGGGSTGYITRIGQGGLVNAGPDIAGPAVILFAYWSEGAGVTTPSISCSALTVDFALIETIDYTETSGIGSPSMDANMSLFVGIVGMGDTLPSGTVLTISPTGIVWSAGVYAAFGVDIASVVVQSASASDDSGATSLINTLAAPASANNLIFSALSSVQGLQLGTTSLAPGTYIEDFLLANGAGPDSHGSRQAWGYEAGSLPGAPSQTWTVAAPNPVDDFDTGMAAISVELAVPGTPAISYAFELFWGATADVRKDDVIVLGVWNGDSTTALAITSITYPGFTFTEVDSVVITPTFGEGPSRLTVFTSTVPFGFDPNTHVQGQIVFGSNQVQDGSIECGAAAIRGVAETPVQSATATATDGTPTVAMTVASGNLGFAYAASEDAFGAPVDAAWQPVEVAQGSYGNGLWQQWIEGIASTPDVSWSLSGSDDWGLIAIEFQRLKPAPGRSGDDFASAIPISGRGFHYRLASDKVALYTAQDFEENIGVLFYTLWFSWKPAVGTYTIDTTGSGYTPIITLMSGTWWIPTFIDSNNPNLTFTADGVTTYYIQIGGFFDGDFGNLTLSVT